MLSSNSALQLALCLRRQSSKEIVLALTILARLRLSCKSVGDSELTMIEIFVPTVHDKTPIYIAKRRHNMKVVPARIKDSILVITAYSWKTHSK